MELVVHGTKGGYRILFKTPNAPSIGSDIRNNVSSEAALGKSAYSIAFASGGCVFTKYIIISDTLRSDATGFIAFSLFLLSNEELSNKGADVKSILDELSNHYMGNYVRNNSINRGDTSIIQEDWSFVSNILSKKTEQDKNRNDIEIQPHVKEAAFVFYQDDLELQEYFTKPFQEEYTGYKQILLISNESRNSAADLLDTLRNSGVELKGIDLRNEYFYLNIYNRSKGLTITANGRPRSDGKTNNTIRAKEKVEIKYIKDYYEPIEVEGTLSNRDSEVFKYLEIKGNQISVNWEALSNDLVAIKKSISFQLKNHKGDPVINAEIICRSNSIPKSVKNNQITFSGEELGQRWIVFARKGDNLYSDERAITPENETRVELVLNEHKKVKFSIVIKNEKESDWLFSNTKITIKGKDINNGNPVVDFIDDEINQEFQVLATYDDRENIFCGHKDFCPRNQDTVEIELRRENKPKYHVNVGERGKIKIPNKKWTYDRDGKDIAVYIKPQKGWKFTGFKLDESQKLDGFDGTLTAQYVKKNFFIRPIGIVVTTIAFLALGVGVWTIFFKSDKDEPTQITDNQIIDYVEGVELYANTLNTYKGDWEKQKPEIKEEGNSVWYNPMNWLGDKGAIDSTDYKRWKGVSNDIEQAIIKRRLIDSLDFIPLQGLHYYPRQQNFKNVVNSIDSNQYDAVKSRLTDVSSWDLNRIADSIRYILNPTPVNPDNEEDVTLTNILQAESATPKVVDSGKSSIGPANNSNSETLTSKNSPNPPVGTDNPNDIVEKLQSGSVSKQQLEKWRGDARMTQYKTSIDLYLKFWETIKPGMQKADSDRLLGKINSDKYLKKSELQSFLNSVCAKSESFKKYSGTPGKAICKTIDELRDKIK